LKGVLVETQGLLPSAAPLQLIDPAGQPGQNPGELTFPEPDVLVGLHRRMVLGRRFDTQATVLAKQGRLAVYPSSRGQDACQVGAALALRGQDWLFPTYRDSVAILTRGVDAAETLALLRGDWHCGYDPYEHRVAPQCTPLATNTLHAVGLAHAATLQAKDQVALVLLGDGATSEGDAHEALNFAALWKAPVVFLVRTTGTRSACRWPSRPRRRRWPRRGSATAFRRCLSTGTTPQRSTPPRGPAWSGPRPAAGRR
jgi:pyruvate dehydrogenase E1 component alpha subunit